MEDFEDFDFGFTAVTEEELESVQENKTLVQKTEKSLDITQKKVDTMYNMIKPLLNNLQKNPEKDYIYWPNRLSKLEEFSDKLDEVYKS
jgi:hypothetical protein